MMKTKTAVGASTFSTCQSDERSTKFFRSGAFVKMCVAKVTALAMNMIRPT